MNLRTALILGVCLIPPPVRAEPPSASYAGQQNRPIKALSPEDIAALLKGEGLGMAKAAELNGYPGPRHVLDLAAQLKLTPDQRQQVQAVFDRMSTGAKSLGAELVSRERVLDQLFQNGEILPDRLSAEAIGIAELQGRLRSNPSKRSPGNASAAYSGSNCHVSALTRLWRSGCANAASPPRMNR